jgi:methionyl-tRNA synthetase
VVREALATTRTLHIWNGLLTYIAGDKCGGLLDPFELINPRCKLDGAKPIARNTRHMFLSLDKLAGPLEEWFTRSSKEGKWDSHSIAITKSWIDKGLEGRSITRDMKWGVPVPLPGYENKVIYVWFDACIGYRTSPSRRNLKSRAYYSGERD